MRDLSIIGVMTFLFVLSGVVPVVATDWGQPLATDPAGDWKMEPPEDIRSVDARYANDFVFFRFVMNYYIMTGWLYRVNFDFDKNISTGWSGTDIGKDFYLDAVLFVDGEDLKVAVALVSYNHSNIAMYYVYYNMTANNGTAMTWSSPEIVPNLPAATFINSSQGEIVFGVNWTWITGLMATEGVLGDNLSMYLDFEAGMDSDWCPDRTASPTDFIVWDIEAPTVTINAPGPGQPFDAAPSYSVAVRDNLGVDSVWCSLDGGATNAMLASIGIPGPGSTNMSVVCNGTIDQALWDAAPYGEVTIVVYARDLAGYLVSATIVVVKNFPVTTIFLVIEYSMFGVLFAAFMYVEIIASRRKARGRRPSP